MFPHSQTTLFPRLFFAMRKFFLNTKYALWTEQKLHPFLHNTKLIGSHDQKVGKSVNGQIHKGRFFIQI